MPKHGLDKQRADCADKFPHHSEAKARAAGWAVLARTSSNATLWPYQCIRCRHWHLTSNPLPPGVRPITRHGAGVL